MPTRHATPRNDFPGSSALGCRAVVAASMMTFAAGMFWTSPLGAQDVIEGETTIVNLRETDGRLGPLITTLVVMGACTLLATILFWWMTRPKRRQHGGTSHG